MMQINKRITVVAALLCALSSYGQQFDRYVPLQSKGAVPTDFSLPTSQKIAVDKRGQRGGLSPKEQRIFVEQVNYTIDGLLKSGLVTYGNEVSTYVQRIGDRLTASDPNLANKLRFYTLNTNEANAFSTDQGMVFVTTGLIAQMTNEAQLAFVLAHEIVHYSEEHVLDLYGYVMDNKSLSYGEKVRFFSKYSRDNEFEADRKGIELYHKAGYAPGEITKTFDILIYSYLPFEEVPFNKQYFNSPLAFVPESLFKGSKSQITAKQKYNDRLNSHPNVAKRIEALEKEIGRYAEWGTVLNYPEQQFGDIREICRFESLLNDVYDAKSVDALYSIFLLERDHADSHFLRRCKSQVWLELMKKEELAFMSYEYVRSFNTDQAYYEGEISVLSQVLGRIPREGKVAMGLRIIRDAYLKDTTDATMRQMWDKAIEVAALNDEFELDQFSGNTFQEAAVQLDSARRAAAADTSSATQPQWDKYETIKNQRAGLTIDAGIDSSKFYLYAISDLVKDSVFNARFSFYKNKARDKEQEEDDFYTLTDSEQEDFNREESEAVLHQGMKQVLLVNPIVTERKGYDRIDYKKSEKLETTLLNAVQSVSTDKGINVRQLDRREQNTMTTQQYNDLAFIMRSMEKGVRTTQPDVFLLDADRLDTLKTVYGSSKVLLLDLTHSYDSGINAGTGILFTVLFPVGMIYFPMSVLSGHSTQLNVYVMDLDKGEIVVNSSYYSHDQASRKMLELRLDALFNQLKQPSNEKN